MTSRIPLRYSSQWLPIAPSFMFPRPEVTERQGWGARELGFFEGARAGAIKMFGSSSSYPIIEKM